MKSKLTFALTALTLTLALAAAPQRASAAHKHLMFWGGYAQGESSSTSVLSTVVSYVASLLL
ncbi:MAG: hypothetical protein WAN28_09910 [Terracidiphilus sp.]